MFRSKFRYHGFGVNKPNNQGFLNRFLGAVVCRGASKRHLVSIPAGTHYITFAICRSCDEPIFKRPDWQTLSVRKSDS